MLVLAVETGRPLPWIRSPAARCAIVSERAWILAARAMERAMLFVRSLVGTFVGRNNDVAAVRTLLRNGRDRLVTLTGAAGIGKTRLAREVARLFAAEGRTTIECDLLDARSLDDIAGAIARALDAPALADANDVFDRLGAHLAERGECVL